MATPALLYGFWASSCSWRVRAVLRMKGVPFEERTVDIVAGQKHLTSIYRDINPAQKVPALLIGDVDSSFEESTTPEDALWKGETRVEEEILPGGEKQIHGHTLVESMAIIQYLEDTRPDRPLMPATPIMRAQAREICETIVSGIQPLQNVGLKPHFPTEEQYVNFTKYWTDRGLQTLEELLAKSSGKYCVGDKLSLADVCLVPQVYNAVTRHKLQIAGKYPTVSKLYETLLKERVFQETHPMAVRDAVKSKI